MKSGLGKIKKSVSQASNIWYGFKRTFDWLGSWLSWNRGNGLKKWFWGLTLSLGVNIFINFPVSLILFLSDLGLNKLAHVRNPNSDIFATTYWYSASDLGLDGDLAGEWFNFISGLNHLGIRLREEEDKLVWTCKKSGVVTAKGAYEAISFYP